MKEKHPEKQRGQKPLMEELEPRILMSASLEGLLADDNLNLNDNNYTQPSEHLVITENDTVAIEADDSIRRELVIVDTSTPDFQLLLDDLLNQQTSERQFNVLLLDNNQNGIDQITAALSNYQNLDAIHIVSDGNNGNIDLGNTTLSYDNIDVYSGDIASWSNALAQDADILIYGCELASGDEGINLIDSLSVLTGADIAASDDLTGATNLGGDWELEYQNGNIETELAFSLEAQQNWSNVLAIIDFSGTVYQTDGSTNVGAGATITLIVNGNNLGSETTDSDGNYSITANVNNDDAVAIFIDDSAYKSTLVTKINGATNLTGLNLTDDTLTVRSDSGDNLTNADMRMAIGGNGDLDILFNVDGSDKLTVEGSATELHVAVGQTYAPGGDIDTSSMRVQGIFQGGSGVIDIDDDLLIDGGAFSATSATTYLAEDFTVSNGGTFNASSGMVVFNSSNNSIINSGTSTFNNVVFDKGSSDITITNTVEIYGNLTLTSVNSVNAGTLSLFGNVTTNDSNVSGSTAFIFSGSGTQLLSGGGELSDGDIAINGGGVVELTSAIRFDDSGQDLTINNGTLDLKGFDLTVNGVFTVKKDQALQLQGKENVSFDSLILGDGSDVIYNGGIEGSYTVIQGWDYQDLIFDSVGSVFNLSGDESIADDLVIYDGNTLVTNGFNLSVADTFYNDGSFKLQGDETLNFTADSNRGDTIYTGNGTYNNLALGGSYYNLTFDGNGTWVLDSNLVINRDLNIISGTLDVNNNDNYSITINRDWIINTGTFLSQDGAVIFSSFNAATIESGTSAFNDLIFAHGNKRITISGTADVNGDFTLTAVFSISGDSITVAGDITTTDEASYPSNTLIILDGNTDQTISAAGSSGALSGIEINKSEGTLFLEDEIIIDSTRGWKYIAGTVDSGSSTVVFSTASATIDAAGMSFNNVTFFTPGNINVNNTLDINGDLVIKKVSSIQGGDITVAGDIITTDGVSDSSPSRALIILDGDTNQTISAAGNSGALSGIEINKSGGTLFLEDELIIDSTRGWKYTNGTVESGSSTVVFDTASATIDATGMSFNNVTFFTSGSITVNDTLDINGDFVITEAGTIQGGDITLAGNLINNETSLSSPSTSFTLDGEGTQTISSVTGAQYSSNTFTIDKNNGTVQLLSDFSPGGDLILAQGILDLNGYNLNNIYDNFIIETAGTLQLNGSESIAFANQTLNAGSTVTYMGTETYTINDWVYQNLSFNNAAGTYQFDNAATILGNLTIDAGTVDTNGNNLTVSNTFSNDGTLQLVGTETVNLTMDTDSGTVEYTGGSNYSGLSGGDVYYNLSFNDSGSNGNYELQAALNVNNNLSITDGLLNTNSTNDYGITVNGNLSQTGGQIVANNSSITVGGDFTANSGESNTGYINSTITLNGNTDQTLTSGGNQLNNLVLNTNANNNIIIADDLDINGNFTLNSGNLDIARFDVQLYTAGNVTFALNSSIDITGRSANWTFDGTSVLTDNTLGLQNLGNVVINGTNLTLDNATQMQNVTINNGNLNLNGYDITVDSNLTVTGGASLTLNGNEAVTAGSVTLASGSLVVYDGTGNYSDLVLGNNYSNLALSNGTWELDNNLDIDNNLIINNNATLDVGTDQQINIAGTWNNTANFNAQNGTVIFDGINQFVLGSTQFFNFIKIDAINDGSDVSLSFDNTGTQTINGTLTLQGLDSNDRVNLNSNISDSQWSIVLASTAVKSITFVSVRDSNASGSEGTQIPVNATYSDDDGNNTAWTFNEAPTAANNSVTTNEDTPYIFTLADFNFSDINNDSLDHIRITDLESVGTLQLNGVDVTLNQTITAADIAAGNVTFTPVENVNGNTYDSFQFRVNDGMLDSANTYTLTVNVDAVNDAPTASNQAITMDEDTVYIFTLSDFSYNDVDNDAFESIRITTLETVGTLQLNGVDVTLNQTITAADITAERFVFTPATNANGNNYDQFYFQVNDSSVTSNNTYSFTINVNSIDDAPVILDSTLTIQEDELTLINIADLIANGSDADGDTLTLLAFTQPGNGTLTDNGDGTLTYSSETDYNGEDSFSYTLTDSQGNNATATLAITITPVEDMMITEEALQSTTSSNETTEATEILVEETVETLTQSIQEETPTTQEAQSETTQEHITEANNEEKSTQPETAQSNETTTAEPNEKTNADQATDETREEDQVHQQIPTDSAIHYWGAQPVAAYQLDADLAHLAKINPALAKELNELSRSGTSIAFSTSASSYAAHVSGLNLLHNEHNENALYNNHDTALWNALDEMAMTMNNNDSTNPQAAQQELIVSVATGAAWSVSAGIVASSLRSGSLVASFMSSAPLWNWFDPLPVLSISADDLIKQQEQYDQDADKENNKYRALEKVFD